MADHAVVMGSIKWQQQDMDDVSWPDTSANNRTPENEFVMNEKIMLPWVLQYSTLAEYKTRSSLFNLSEWLLPYDARFNAARGSAWHNGD